MHSRSAKFWAWTVSIAVHLIVLTIFGLVKFSQAEAQDRQHPVPTAKINRIKKLIETSPVIPKPKIKPAKNKCTAKTNGTLSADRIFDAPRPSPQDRTDFAKPLVPTGRFIATDAISPRGVEFFGTRTDRRKLCYVVDCSGSMRGLFRRVREELKDSIATLQPDQYFYISFFGDAKVSEFGNGRLIRATKKAKSAAYDFIDSVRPAGRTNAQAALEIALRICNNNRNGPSVIYFLTDGFELTTEDTQRFPQKVTNLLGKFAPETKVNTIGFWPSDDDRQMLETIALRSGGEFVFVTDVK
ncbi:MAG: vWA domain-containing protein [Planctomycetota bacterium]